MTILDEFRSDEQRVLDRLVDGELGLHQRRELLAGLDDEPGAWRRCALAFLESQSWHWQMSRMATEPILAQLSAAPRQNRAARHTIWGGILAIAASLIVAFAVGTRFPTLDPTGETVATNDPSAAKESPSSNVPGRESEPAIDRPAGGSDEVQLRPWQTVTLTPAGNGGSEEPIELRVVEDGSGQLFAEQTPLSPTFARSLEQDGWEVNRSRRLLPFALSDGRQLVVPIEEFDLHRPDIVEF